MKYKDIYKKSKETLLQAGVSSPAFDTLCLFEHFFNLTRDGIILHGDKSPDDEPERLFFIALAERSNGRPLQYILGKWPFMDFEFKINEGVLIPRDDTAVLVEAALKLTQKVKKPVAIDLCSGSGIVAISYAKYRTDSLVTALEKFDVPYSCLCENIAFNKTDNVTPKKQDVLSAFTMYDDKSLDIIMSNPPYIKEDEISTLQVEVQNEPIEALNGGKSGLDFYRQISLGWIGKLKPGGMIAFEVGDTQHFEVAEILMSAGCKSVFFFKDLQNINRVVAGIV